jgi:hypothetical protein
MEENINILRNVGIAEREEIIVDFARWLETAAQEAVVFGERRFATMSAGMAEAMRFSADELARDKPEAAEQILQQAHAMISRFKAAYPYRVVSRSVH